MWRQVVAQSPEDNAPDGEVLRYDVGWKALNTMLKSGRSLSGNERNCAFLNTGKGRFADISQATGLDLNDDGRVVAKVDWDQDGDLDFWITNRTAPLVRFLRNNTNDENHYVQFKLQGTTCNRDAIGARLELKFKDKIRTKTVTSGGAYLSHHSEWLHFGLGKKEEHPFELDSVLVSWPDGKEEYFYDTSVDCRHVLIQGAGKAVSSSISRSISLAPSKIHQPPVSDEARIVLIQPLPIPAMKYRDTDEQECNIISGKPRLISLWSSKCPCCMEELTEWKQHFQTFINAGVEVVTINVETTSDQSNALGVFKKNKFPFKLGFGGKEIGAQFDVIQRSVLSRQRSLPLPSSFLINGRGELSVIYKGPVSAEQVAIDSKLLEADLDRILAASSPFAGKWLGIPLGSSPNSLAIRFVEGGFTKEAEDYLVRLTTEGTQNPVFNAGNAYVLLGAIYLDQKRYEEAATAFRETLKIDPYHRQSAIELAGVLMILKKPDEAVPYYLKALERRKDDPELHFKLGTAYLESGKIREGAKSLKTSIALRPSGEAHFNLGNIALSEGDISYALEQYSQATKFSPPLAPAANNLAWLLAALPDKKMRDEKRALQVATRLVGLPNHRTASHLDTLAVAQASNGLFEEAVITAKEALKISNDSAITQGIQERLILYQNGKPYRE